MVPWDTGYPLLNRWILQCCTLLYIKEACTWISIKRRKGSPRFIVNLVSRVAWSSLLPIIFQLYESIPVGSGFLLILLFYWLGGLCNAKFASVDLRKLKNSQCVALNLFKWLPRAKESIMFRSDCHFPARCFYFRYFYWSNRYPDVDCTSQVRNGALYFGLAVSGCESSCDESQTLKSNLY